MAKLRGSHRQANRGAADDVFFASAFVTSIDSPATSFIPLLSGTSLGLNRNDNTTAKVKMVGLRLAEVQSLLQHSTKYDRQINNLQVWLTTRVCPRQLQAPHTSQSQALTQIPQLLESAIFHKVVKRVHKKVHEIKLGEKLEDPSEMGGTNIDTPKPDAQRFLRYYMEELKDQFRGTTKK